MIKAGGITYQLQSLGTSNNTLPVFLNILRRAKTKLVIDIRSRPRSRWFPHFNQNRLRTALESRNIGYLWMGDVLGGFQQGFRTFEEYVEINPGNRFADGIARLLKVIEEAGGSVAIMCSEKDVKKCHRKTIIEYIQENLPKLKNLEVTYLQASEEDLG